MLPCIPTHWIVCVVVLAIAATDGWYFKRTMFCSTAIFNVIFEFGVEC